MPRSAGKVKPKIAERGQALPLVLACLFCVGLLMAFCFRAGERLIQRERVRARADVTAFSGGISYARALNVLALTQHAALAGWVIAIASYGSQTEWLRRVQKLQQYLLDYGPWLSEIILVGLGAENGILALPAWNRPVLFADSEGGSFSLQSLGYQALKPSFNVEPEGLVSAVAGAVDHGLKRTGMGTQKEGVQKALHGALDHVDSEEGRELKERLAGMVKKALPNWNLDFLLKTDHYEYRRRSDGVVVKVDPKDVRQNPESDGRGGSTLRNKATAKFGNKYVKAVETLNREFQLTLKDRGDHVLTLLALQAPSPRREEQRPGWVCALSQVQVAGGNMDMWDFDNAGYMPTQTPVRLFADGANAAGGGGAALLERLPLPPGLELPLRVLVRGAGDFLAVQH